MIDTKLLEAWCHWVELETLDEISEDRKLMAEQIRAVLAELKAARKVIRVLNVSCLYYGDCPEVFNERDRYNEVVKNQDEARRG